MKLPALFKAKEPWQWPSCKQPKTLSFRAGDDVFKTVNSMFFDANTGVETPESWFTHSSESASFSTESDRAVESLEVVVHGARSERLFFEPGGDTSSILEEAKTGRAASFPFEESVVLAMESNDPYVDFRLSMEEMVETHGMKEWEQLEELLGWYLKVNNKNNHGFIISAFIDLLLAITSSSSSSDSTSYSSAVSSFSPSSTLRSSQTNLHELEVEDEDSVLR
ncbi:Transcription repressor OFP13 [Hibiscus syriacus]|uniref:Transcription repressor n=1 Tax=Hibiscus syriacus TaxID=106335 RepID=A0A6A2WBZ5_HIBSY|nr:transcription repressor OFP13-like [Hibiscus syriacus]KAE8655562.1 Transcription repressor OFP13 [Hibiscus syriacus]